MNYIPADKLIAEIEGLRHIAQGYLCGSEKRSDLSPGQYRMEGIDTICSNLLSFINSLQQEQPQVIDHICSRAGIPAPYMDGNQWCILKGDNIQCGVVGFGNTKEDAIVDFIKNIPFRQEQPEVDIDDEIDKVIADYSFIKTIDSGRFKTTVLDYAKIARYFYKLGLKARKEESK